MTKVALAALVLTACATEPVSQTGVRSAATKPEPDLGALWVRTAAEYEALGHQAYGAGAEDLGRLFADRSWSALPEQTEAAGLKAAIILDIDETLLYNVQFQLEHEPPFTDEKFDAWHATHTVPAVPGAREFVQRARAAGIDLFFVTNRRCAPMADFAGPCPQERITLQDLQDAGIDADTDHVMLVGEQPEWTQEKKVLYGDRKSVV